MHHLGAVQGTDGEGPSLCCFGRRKCRRLLAKLTIMYCLSDNSFIYTKELVDLGCKPLLVRRKDVPLRPEVAHKHMEARGSTRDARKDDYPSPPTRIR